MANDKTPYFLYRKADGLIINVMVGKAFLHPAFDVLAVDALTDPDGASMGDRLVFDEGSVTVVRGGTVTPADLIDFGTLQRDAQPTEVPPTPPQNDAQAPSQPVEEAVA